MLASIRNSGVTGISGDELALKSGDPNIDEAPTVARRRDAGHTAVIRGADADKRSTVADPAVDLTDCVAIVCVGDDVGGGTGGVGG